MSDQSSSPSLVLRRAVGIAGLLLVGAVTVVPVVWALSTSLKHNSDILAVPPRLIPPTVTLEHYQTVVDSGVDRAAANSAMLTFAAIVIVLLLAIPGGYGLSRFQFRFKRTIFVLFIAALAMPMSSLLVPLLTVLAPHGLTNRLSTMALLYASIAVPFAVWVMKAHFDTVPRDIEHAGAIDGYARRTIVRKVVLPGTKPALLTAALYTFISSWNDFIVNAVIANQPDKRTLPVATSFFITPSGRAWGPLMASAVLTTVVPIVLFFVFRKHLTSGVGAGAIKG
jgi:ABC-type glycerol-3-phosphate transport system permease component